MILPATGREGAIVLAERLRKVIAATPWPHRQLTVSLGVSTLSEATADCTALLSDADHALYDAKRDGRDRVMQAAA